MTDFRLDIVADGTTVALCPVGIVDRDGARVLLDAVDAVRGAGGTMVSVRLDGVDRFTEDGLRTLALADLPIERAGALQATARAVPEGFAPAH